MGASSRVEAADEDAARAVVRHRRGEVALASEGRRLDLGAAQVRVPVPLSTWLGRRGAARFRDRL